jgi:hypothetical protein
VGRKIIVILLFWSIMGCAHTLSVVDLSQMSGDQLRSKYSELMSKAEGQRDSFSELRDDFKNKEYPSAGAAIGAGLAGLIFASGHAVVGRSYLNQCQQIKDELQRREALGKSEETPSNSESGYMPSQELSNSENKLTNDGW